MLEFHCETQATYAADSGSFGAGAISVERPGKIERPDVTYYSLVRPSYWWTPKPN